MQFYQSFTILCLALQISVAAPLEPADGKVLLGAWYDRNNSDTPKAVNARLGYKPLAFFQTDIDFSGTIKPWTAPGITEQLLQQLKDTNSDADAYLTVYPFQGLNSITDAQLADMAARIKSLIISGRRVFLRFAPEMNGSWFVYGQQPTDFIAAWKRCITYWRTAIGADSSKVAFIWAPNSGNGYPWARDVNNPGENYSPDNNTADGLQRIHQLDTNGNGNFDADDDPYLPFYPGDEFVDWVGLSMYTYGYQYPWWTNDIPLPDKFEGMLQGIKSSDPNQDWGRKPFYTYFSSPE
ncbi:UNVERIFIED_CONTAM: hypothetical protein HDU68_002333, partial [Siphonaria sp. JEL0065]